MEGQNRNRNRKPAQKKFWRKDVALSAALSWKVNAPGSEFVILAQLPRMAALARESGRAGLVGRVMGLQKLARFVFPVSDVPLNWEARKPE